MAWTGRAVASRRRRWPTWPSGPGVSRQTVSNAVNNPDLLRPDTLARVQEAIAELGYSPNRAARNLRTRASHLIGLQFNPAQEGTANAAMDRFVHSLVETSGESRLPRAAVLRRRRDDPLGGYDDLLRSTAVDAFVVTDTYLGNPQAAWLTEQRRAVRRVRPAVGRPRRDRTRGSTSTARAGAELATDHLLDQGHTRIAWIGWRKDSFIGEDRRSGWTRAMHARDLPTTGLASRVEDTVASGREAAARAARRGRSPTAFVCASDTLAMGVLHALGDRGLHRGKDIAVVGFDDSQVAQVVPGRADLGPPAARAGRRRAGQGARGPARPRRRVAGPACCSPRPSTAAPVRAVSSG